MKTMIIKICCITIAWGIVFLGYSCKDNRNTQKVLPVEKTSSEKTGGMPAKPDEAEQVREEAPAVEIPVEKQRLIGVRTFDVSAQSLEKVIRTTGKIEYDERKLTTINAKVEGWIDKLHVNYTGMHVKKGEPLADIYSPELWATQQEFINLVRWSKKTARTEAATSNTVASSQEGSTGDFAAMLSRDAEQLLEAARQRLKLWDISDVQIKKIEESERPIRALTVYSPASGFVLQKYAVQGMKVMAGEKLLDLSDLSTVWITADIYEYELPMIRVGQTARIQLAHFPGKELTSRIDFVSPTISPETRTAQVRFNIPNHGGKLKPGMFTDVEITVDLGRRLSVPNEAVIDTGLRQIVYVDKGDGFFEPRAITTGLKAERHVEVLEGLKAGEKVASSANFLIDSEAKLKGIEAPGKIPGKKQEPAPAAGGHKH